MRPKADMVPNECGFTQSERASCLCARSVTFSMLACNGKGWWTYNKRGIFCHHADTICHPDSSYVTTKLHETSACGCNNNTIFQNELFSRFLPSTNVAWQRRSCAEGDAAKVTRWRHWSIHHFSCLKVPFCVTTVSNSYDYIIKWLVQWYNMRLVCMVGYCLHFSNSYG